MNVKAQAKQLRREGKTYRVIAEQLGFHVTTVYKWINPEKARRYNKTHNAKPERRARKRELERIKYLEPCRGGCGGLVLNTSQRSGYCRRCVPRRRQQG